MTTLKEKSISAPIQTRRLGRTDMEISRVGFGAWAIGGGDWAMGWGSQNDKESIAAIRHAIDRGVNWIDSAAVYGLGRSEQIVRQALSGLPPSRRPYIFTKCGLVWDEKSPMTPPRQIGAQASIRHELEQSLRRLGVDRIDLYQMHWPAEDVPLEDYWQTLNDLKKEGKLRAIGLSNHDAGQLAAAEKIGHVDCLQPPFSAIRRESATALLPWCAAHETGVIVYSPMQSGLLSGRFTVQRATKLPKNDWRSRDGNYSGDKLDHNLHLAEALRPIAAQHHSTVAAVAIAWTLAWPGVTGAIVGARRAEQVDGWLAGAIIELSPADLVAIADAITQSAAGSGPSLPPL
jgi:aryl-alcohol dehydrogenase-like predicted oxidoreductase